MLAEKVPHIKTPELKDIQVVFDNHYEIVKDRERLLPKIEFLERLAETTTMAVVTGRPREQAEWFLDKFKIRHLFQTVVCMEDGPPKPNPDPV